MKQSAFVPLIWQAGYYACAIGNYPKEVNQREMTKLELVAMKTLLWSGVFVLVALAVVVIFVIQPEASEKLTRFYFYF